MFTKTIKHPRALDTQEAFNLWDTLSSRYTTINQIEVFQNFVHDKDFSLLLKQVLKENHQNQVKELEKLLGMYNITFPRRPPESTRTPSNTEAFEDSFVAGLIMTMLQEDISMVIRIVRTSVTEDNLRNIFQKFLFQELNIYNQVIRYFKAKGWIGSPPMYPQAPIGSPETLDTGEAYHLWDHLTSRYDTVEITQIYETFAHDGDLKTLLQSALRNTLEKQVKVIEKEMNYFALPLPQRPPKKVKNLENTEVVEDLIIFRNVFTGMQYFFNLHATALKQATTNDRLRKIYTQFLKEEMDLYNKFVKYGKLKGWIRHVPMYRLSKS